MIPQPPNNEIRQSNHYWLDHYDCDGHYFERIILQWAPSAKRWCHSGNVGTGMYVPITEYWKIVCKQDIPE